MKKRFDVYVDKMAEGKDEAKVRIIKEQLWAVRAFP